MAKECCGTCKFWGDKTSYQKSEDPYRACEGVPYDDETSPAYVIDHEGYSAGLLTRAEFSCALFQPKEEPEVING